MTVIYHRNLRLPHACYRMDAFSDMPRREVAIRFFLKLHLVSSAVLLAVLSAVLSAVLFCLPRVPRTNVPTAVQRVLNVIILTCSLVVKIPSNTYTRKSFVGHYGRS